MRVRIRTTRLTRATPRWGTGSRRHVMKKRTLSYLLLTGLMFGAGLGAYQAQADAPKPPTRGTGTVYRGIRDDQIEQLTSPDRIKAVATKASSPSAIWQALEH